MFLTFPIFAQIEGNPENWCRNGFFARESENYYLATIKGKKAEKVYFYGDDDSCPNGKNCRQKSYLIPNDEVIVSRKFGKWACVWFQPKSGSETVGWIPLEKLKNNLMRQGFDEIVGNWGFYENDIAITKTNNPQVYKVTGNAFWRGAGDNIHTGELDNEAKFVGKNLKLGEDETDEYACKVTLRLVGKYLIVSDNLNCGGANVTFSGVYLRQ